MIQLVFASFISTEFVDVDIEGLRRLCDEGEARSPRHQGHDRAGTLDVSSPVAMQMLDAVTTQFNRVFHQLGYRRDMRLEITQAWANVGNNLHIDAPHMHPGSFFSGCLYLSDADMTGDPEERGGLKLLTPAPISRLKNTPDIIEAWNACNSDTLTIYPKERKLLIFPSWLMHYVTPSKAPGRRYSIAFDTRVIPARPT